MKKKWKEKLKKRAWRIKNGVKKAGVKSEKGSGANRQIAKVKEEIKKGREIRAKVWKCRKCPLD